MGNRKIPLVEEEYFHLYNRGNSKQNIFLDNDDRQRFVKLLYLCNSEKKINFRDDIVKSGIDAWDFDRGKPIVSLGAWVLMANHFHLYITSHSTKDGLRRRGNEHESGVTEFMRKLSTAYSKYFNKKYNRTGSLFEGRFKSTHVADDVQAKYLFSYIHLNPIKIIDPAWKENGVKDISLSKKFLDEYQWSSYFDYRGIVRDENAILTKNDFPEYFSSKELFRREIFEWLTLP